MRVITLDELNIVIGIKEVGEDCALGLNDLASDVGNRGEIRQSDGTFITPAEPILIESMPTMAEMQMQTLLNTEYLVVISELTNL